MDSCRSRGSRTPIAFGWWSCAPSRTPLRLWPRIALVGAINSAIPFALFAWAAQRAPAGVIAISNSMAVLFTALVAFLFFGERIRLRHGVALFAGFAGVVVLAGAKSAGASLGWAVAAGTGTASELRAPAARKIGM